MFSELGYKLIKEDEERIWYKKVYYRLINGYYDNDIIFHKKSKSLSLDTINIEELKAIVQKCRELGWLVDKELPLLVKDNRCPSCDCINSRQQFIYNNETYCMHCGQKLKWKE